MNNLFAILLAPLVGASIIFSGIEFSTLLKVKQLENPDSRPAPALASGLSSVNTADDVNLFMTATAFEEAAQLPLVDDEVAYQSARWLYRAAMVERDQAERIKYFCRSLSQMGKALRRSPRDSRLLINWANLRQLLANVPCTEEGTNGDFEQVARYALENDPTNGNVMFSAAQVLLWANQRAEAEQLMNRFLLLSQTVRQPQLDFIEQQMSRPEHVKAIVPGQFPQIVDWSERLRSRNPELFREARTVLTDLQLEAMTKNDEALARGTIPAQLFFERLSSLLEVVDSSVARRKIDTELSRYYGSRGQERLQRYLDQRSMTENVEVIRSALLSDTRPLKSPLVIWAPVQRLTLNHFYTSVGFYLPRNSIAQFIELVGQSRSPMISEVPFKLLVSDNNQEWEDVSGQVTVESAEFARRSRLIFSLPLLDRRYWKVHFASSARDGEFSNDLDTMVKVYGRVGR